MQIRVWQHGQDFIVYDADLIRDPSTSLFDARWWDERGLKLDSFRGRGLVTVVQHEEHQWVLRHFRRGGLVGRVVDRSYFWTGLALTRPWREWHLLAAMREQGLPVPRPVAAHVNRGGLRYCGDILSELIADCTSLADVLLMSPLPLAEWQALGAVLRRFHHAGVHHPDLNARNILRRSDGQFFLVDFDRGRLDARSALIDSELPRLRRSLDKFHSQNPGRFAFDDGAWRALLQGYQG